MGNLTYDRGLGITGGIEPGAARELAALCCQLGYQSMWCNDEAAAPGLEMLAHFAAAAPGMKLGVGVLPIDRHPPQKIAADIDRLGLDPALLSIGIGSGALRPQIEPLEAAVAELRELLAPETRIVVAAMRPRLCRVAGAIADGVLLNWMLPGHAARAREWVGEGAAEAGRPAPPVGSYVRVAIGDGAPERLRNEESHYRNINEGHREHFDAMKTPIGSVGVAAASRAQVMEGLEPYEEALDLVIVRVLADHDSRSLEAVARGAAPLDG